MLAFLPTGLSLGGSKNGVPRSLSSRPGLVASASGSTPILPLSPGTNNVFPQVREATIAGLAAGLVAKKAHDLRPIADILDGVAVQFDYEQTAIAESQVVPGAIIIIISLI